MGSSEAKFVCCKKMVWADVANVEPTGVKVTFGRFFIAVFLLTFLDLSIWQARLFRERGCENELEL